MKLAVLCIGLSIVSLSALGATRELPTHTRDEIVQANHGDIPAAIKVLDAISVEDLRRQAQANSDSMNQAAIDGNIAVIQDTLKLARLENIPQRILEQKLVPLVLDTLVRIDVIAEKSFKEIPPPRYDKYDVRLALIGLGRVASLVGVGIVHWVVAKALDGHAIALVVDLAILVGVSKADPFGKLEWQLDKDAKKRTLPVSKIEPSSAGEKSAIRTELLSKLATNAFGVGLTAKELKSLVRYLSTTNAKDQSYNLCKMLLTEK